MVVPEETRGAKRLVRLDRSPSRRGLPITCPASPALKKKKTIMSFQNNANAGDDSRQQNTPTINPFPIPAPSPRSAGASKSAAGVSGRGAFPRREAPVWAVRPAGARRPRLEMPLGDKMPLRSLIRGVKRGKVYLCFYC